MVDLKLSKKNYFIFPVRLMLGSSLPGVAFGLLEQGIFIPVSMLILPGLFGKCVVLCTQHGHDFLGR